MSVCDNVLGSVCEILSVCDNNRMHTHRIAYWGVCVKSFQFVTITECTHIG